MNRYKIKNDTHKPVITENDKACASVLYGLSDFPAARTSTYYAQKNIAQFSGAGVNLVNIDIPLSRAWRRVSPFDSASLIADITYVLDANPNAKILIRLHLNPPYWWMRDNPEECVVYRTKEGDFPGIDDGESERLIENDGAKKYMRVSLASKKWMQDTNEKLEIFLNALKNSPEGEAVMGIQVACGIFGEWHQWGTDVSKPMQDRFREYLKEKYGTNENAVFKPETFRKCDDGFIRDPQKSMDSIDSGKTIQLTTAEAILCFAKTVKEVMPNILCGAFYGYYIGVGYLPDGHLEPDMLYQSEYIDFLCGPFAYSDNRKADGVPTQRALLESNRLRKKLWLTEMDQSPCGTEKFVGGDHEKYDETVSILYRNTLWPLLKGMGFWYYDHRIIPKLIAPDSKNAEAGSIYRKKGWWDTPKLMGEISKIQNFAEKLKDMEYTSNADVLLVYDTESFYYRGDGKDAHYLLHETIGKCGVAFDCIYAKELEICELDRYKCIIFVNSYMICAQDVEKYRALTKGKTVIYLGAHGYCDGHTLSVENIKTATNIEVKKLSEAKTIKTIMGEECEIPENFKPFFEITDKNAEPLAHFDNKRCAAAIKGTEVYVSLHTLPISIAKKVFLDAGVHFYTKSKEPIVTGFGFVAINCHKKEKERTLYLPNGKEINIKSDGYATMVYDINTGEQVF